MKYFKRIDGNGVTTTVESYDFNPVVPGAVEINKEEHDAFVRSIPIVPRPDVAGFYHDFLAAFGVVLTDTLVSKHQLFDKAIQQGNWQVAAQVIALTVSTGEITQAQADQVKVIAAAHNMPL